MSQSVFKRNYENANKSPFKSFNAIFGKIARYASAEVIVHMLQVNCLPVHLYGLDVCTVNSTESKSFEFALFRIYAKIFATSSKDVI